MTRSPTESTDPVLAHAAAIGDAAAQLKPLSHSMSQLIDLNSNPNASTAEVVDVIAHDQVLTAALLREANSAASASSATINTVDTALVRMGMSRVMALAIRMSAAGHLAKAVPQYGLSEGELALLSVTGSIGAEVVREKSKVAMPPETPTAALLRDIGVLVLATFIDEPVKMLLHVTCDAGADLSDSERMVLDASHGEAGGLLCQAWKLPESVRVGVQYHHDPFACTERIAHGVFLADTIAHRIAVRVGRSWSHSAPTDEAVTASMLELGIDPALLDSMVDSTIERFEQRDTGLTLIS